MEYEALHGRSYQPGEAHVERRRENGFVLDQDFSACARCWKRRVGSVSTLALATSRSYSAFEKPLWLSGESVVHSGGAQEPAVG